MYGAGGAYDLRAPPAGGSGAAAAAASAAKVKDPLLKVAAWVKARNHREKSIMMGGGALVVSAWGGGKGERDRGRGAEHECVFCGQSAAPAVDCPADCAPGGLARHHVAFCPPGGTGGTRSRKVRVARRSAALLLCAHRFVSVFGSQPRPRPHTPARYSHVVLA